jgi:hypothetical protein
MRFALLIALAFALPAQGAVVLDFEQFAQADTKLHFQPRQLDIQGFHLLSVPPPGNAFRFVTAGSDHPFFAVSTAIWNGQCSAATTLLAVDGSLFALLSIDLGVVPHGTKEPTEPDDPGPFEPSFIGITASGNAVINTFTVNNTFLPLETFAFSGFDDVISVSWLQGEGYNPSSGPAGSADHHFDNIAIGSAVPLPASLLFWIDGILAGGANIAVRSRRAHTRSADR